MSHLKSLLLACALVLGAIQALAGPLAIDTTSIAGFHGTTPFQAFDLSNNPTGLSGTIDYAVWAPGTFPGAFAGFSASDYVYTYQVNEAGPAVFSSLQIKLTGPADVLNIGDFTGNNGFGVVAGDPSITAFINPLDSANWLFAGIGPGVSSEGLAFSSPREPTFSVGTAIDNGSIAFFMPVPSPAPEPATLTLASCGLGILALLWLHRRRSRC